VCGLVAGLLGSARKCGIVGRFVGLVEKRWVALVLGNGGFAPKNVGAARCLWWVVESYISGLLL